MNTVEVVQNRALNIAVIGKPNAGKSTLFTALSGIRVRTGNYPGVTVERKIGIVKHAGRDMHLVDLPGTYHLNPRSADEQITIDILSQGDRRLGPMDAILCVVDATQLERGLVLIHQLRELGLPIVVSLNMFDVARSRGIEVDVNSLRDRLGVNAVIPTVALRREGVKELLAALSGMPHAANPPAATASSTAQPTDRYKWAESVVAETVRHTKPHKSLTDRLDRILVGRWTGPLVFAVVMFLIFQSIFTWVGPVMDLTDVALGTVSDWVSATVAPGPLRSLLNDGVVAGVGGVIVFVPQIALLFLLLAILEDCGYMARAALIIDALMKPFGLSGKSFLPLLSSFACAVPGIMATRVIESRRDRFITILVAPLMSCSARLPVYLLMIGTFVPAIMYWGWLSLQGLVFFAMMALGLVVAIPVAWLLGKTFFRGERGSFFLELPDYKIPSIRTVLWKAYDGAKEFVVRAGTLIFATAIVIWALGYYPGDQKHRHDLETRMEAFPADDVAGQEALTEELNHESQRLINESYLGRSGKLIEPLVAPCGWDWRLGTAAIASFPAREVMVATLGTIFSLGGEVDENDEGLRAAMRNATWPDGRPLVTLPVALSVMVFFALCAQCVSTLAIMKREMQSWGWTIFSFVYMTVLAYVGAVVTFQVGSRLL